MMIPTLDTYRDKRGKWRWRCVAFNGRILADGGEGYNTRRALNEALVLVRASFVAHVVAPEN